MRHKQQFIFCALCVCALFCLAVAARCMVPPFVGQGICGVQQRRDAVCTTAQIASLEEYYKIDLNTATKQQLSSLSGVGQVKAEYIIEYRVLVGPFESVEDVVNVTGITAQMVESWGNQVYVSPAE